MLCSPVLLCGNPITYSFPTAFFVNRMEEVFSVMKKAEPKESVICESCSELSSTAFCQQCSEYICTECAKAHKKMRLFSSHKVVSIDSLRTTVGKSPADSLPVVCQEVKCSKHKDEPLKLYCRDCHKLVCRDCILIDHKDHEYAFVIDAAPQCKSEIKRKAESVKQISVGLRSAVKSLSDSEKELSDHSTATVKAIDDALDKVASKVAQKRKELKKEAHRVVNKAKEDISVHEKNAQLAVGEVESLLEFMNRNLEMATDQEVLSLEKQMSDQVDRISQLYTNPAQRFPVPKLPQLEVQSEAEVMQVVEDGIYITNKRPLEIPVDPMLAQSISRSPSNLEQSVLGSRVTFSTDEQKGILVFSPTSKSKPSWRQECQEHVPQYIAANLTKVNINVPKEAAAQAMSIAVKLEKENPGLRVDANTDGTVITLAGETSSVLQAREAISSEIVTDEVSVILSPVDFDFVEQVKQHELPSNIECTCNPNTFSIFLKGPKGAISKLTASIVDLTSHVDSPVMLDPLVTEFLKTQAGRTKLEKFLHDRQCHAAVHFSQFPNLTLHLLAERKETNSVKAIVGQLPLHVTSQAIPIPDTVAPIISDLDEFIQLCQNIKQKNGVLIKQVGHEVSAAGFKAEVMGSLAEIKEFLKEKSSPLPSLEMKVGTLVARSIQRSPQGLQKCLHSFPVSLQFDTGRGILRFTPLHYLKPEWEEACKSSVSEYIYGNVAEVKIVVPEKAYADIMSLLYKSEQDGTFVYHYPPNTTSLSFAGETNIVQLTGEKVAQICANYSFISETLSLKAEEYEFLTQLKMQDLVNKFHNIDIDSVPDTHSVQLSGPSKGVKAVKEHIATLLPPTTVTVKLDQAIIEFLASEKGKERLMHLLQEKRSDKCTVYISDSPVQLMLLCTHKHKKAAEKVSEYLPGCTAVSPLQIPDLLLPFLSELPEFLKEVERVERENFAKISVKGREIHVAGFKEGVSHATETLSKFVRVKMIHFQPIQIPIDPMIAMCVQKDPAGLQACVSSISVKCTLKTDTNKPVVSASPTKTTKPDWKKECERLLTSYIDSEYLTEQIKIPKKAASDVFPILISMKTTGNFHFEMPGDGAYAIVAGERSAVKKVQEKIGSICSQIQTSDSWFKQAKPVFSETSLATSASTSIASNAVAISVVITLPNKRTLTLKRGDIVNEKADILVNAANGQLRHGGGVAGALNAASEGKLQHYCNKYMETKRKWKELPVGEVAVTHAGGNLKCFHVIHAVGPDGNTYSPSECERLVKMAIRNTLRAAERLNVTSIALPALSCGLFGVSKDLVARSMIDAITTFTFTKFLPVLSDIRIVIIDEPTYSCFAHQFEQLAFQK